MSVQTMSAEKFIAECNSRETTSKRNKSVASDCSKMEDAPIPPFTEKGLAHLAGLLSDKTTASGGKIPGAPYNKEQKWSEDGFLFKFNSYGVAKVANPEFLKDFAAQVATGHSEYVPEQSKTTKFEKKDKAYPSKVDIEQVMKELAPNGADVEIDMLLDRIEEDFIASGKDLPSDWREITQKKLGK